MIYLDHSATTKVLPQAAEAACAVMRETFGNPSSLHGLGVAAERTLENARESIARTLQAQPQEIVFTSGATEADNLAVFGAVKGAAPPRETDRDNGGGAPGRGRVLRAAR